MATNAQLSAGLIAGMSQRIMLRCRNLEAGLAATVVYAVWKDICVRTEAWRVWQLYDVTAGQTEIVIVPTFNVNVRRIVKVKDNGQQLIAGQGYWFHPPFNIKLRSPEPIDNTKSFGVKFVMDPVADDPTAIDPVVFQMWDNAIFNGCMADLLEMSNMAWYDKAGGQQKKHKLNYERDLGVLRMDADRPGGQTDEPMIMSSDYPFVDAGFFRGGDVASTKVV